MRMAGPREKMGVGSGPPFSISSAACPAATPMTATAVDRTGSDREWSGWPTTATPALAGFIGAATVDIVVEALPWHHDDDGAVTLPSGSCFYRPGSRN
jgi:hypothetical protein